MGRSRRHTPITGATKSTSDTRDKVLAHRRKAGDVRSFAKDGKRRFDPRRWPQLMST
jgi:hypothetical protein